MNYVAGLGLYIDTARFVPSNLLFKFGDITKERTVTCYELVIFLKGGGYSVINGQKHTISAGCVRFHRPGDIVYSHRFHDIYVVHFNVDDEQKGKEVFSQFPHFFKLFEAEYELNLMKKIIAALLSKNDFGCTLSLFELLGSIKEKFELRQQNNKKIFAAKVKKYIEEHFSKKITLDDLAHQFHIHHVYLQRKFKEETGLTPFDYQKQIRISKAKEFLLTTNLSVDEISDLCGFCNTSYFIDVFRKSENITPFKFRQQTNLTEIF